MANMVPFRRGRTQQTMPSVSSSSTQRQQQQQEEKIDQQHQKHEERESAWEARRRRKQRQGQSVASSTTSSTNPRRKKDNLPKDEYDPYDSDPGESYREHCERLKGEGTRSCFTLPRFLQHKVDAVTTEPTPPTSPMRDMEGPRTPLSLPRDLAKVRYSLRTTIGDGGQVQPPSMDERELRPNYVHINVSHWSAFGGRDYMEDRYAIEDLGAVQVEVSSVKSSKPDDGTEASTTAKTKRLKMPLTWVGIFDGHGGEKASQFCADWLSAYVRNEETFPYDMGFAMKSAYTSIDTDFLATGHPDGTTACTATLVGGRRIVCANAGDSRAIVVRRDGTVVPLSRDHKPGMPDETRRISELGGRVIYWGRWRVEGLLAVSRSIGDASLKPYVCSDPEVCEYDIGKDDWFLVMSSDGVWDVMDNEECAHVIIASACVMEDGVLKIDTDRFKWAARNLCDHAKSCGSSDNFSCVVVDLKSCGNPISKTGRYKP